MMFMILSLSAFLLVLAIVTLGIIHFCKKYECITRCRMICLTCFYRCRRGKKPLSAIKAIKKERKETEMKRDLGSMLKNNDSIKLEDVESQNDGVDPSIEKVLLTAKDISVDNDSLQLPQVGAQGLQLATS